MKKIREILEKYLYVHDKDTLMSEFEQNPKESMDKLEKELEEYMDRDVLRQIVNLAYDQELKVVINRRIEWK